MEGATSQRVIARPRDWGIAATVAYVAVIGLVAWPVHTVEAGTGSDWGWVAALSYAAEHGLRFGEQIAFTYGPLGFLNTWYGPVLYYGDVLALSWLFAALIQLLLAGTLLYALRRSLPLALAVVVAAAVLALTPDHALALGFAWCALMVTRAGGAPRDRVAVAFPYAIGALTGIALLGKLNQGAELATLAVIALAARPRRQDALAFAGALIATAAAGWLATGQTLADVLPYLRNGAEVVAGYAGAMGTPDPPHRWTYAAALAIGALAIAGAWDASRGARSPRRWGLIALCVVYAAFNFKEAFVRQDPGHLAVFFGDMLVLFAVLPTRPSRRPLLLGCLAAGAVVLAALAGMHAFARTLNPYANARAAADQMRTLVSPARRDALTAALRTRIAANYQLSPKIVRAVGRHTVMLWPYLYGDIAYAYGFDLRPLPGLEPYSTYTPALDRLSADMLASRRAPDRILRSIAPAIDGRNPTFEAPLATLAILCRYREIAEDGPWHVLARFHDRCGPQRTLGTTSTPWGQPVVVPSPRRREALVLVRVKGAGPHGLERLRALALRPQLRYIALDGARYRLIAATAADGLLLRAPRAADYPQPFAMAPNPAYVVIERDGGNPAASLDYTFVEVPIQPFSASAGGR